MEFEIEKLAVIIPIYNSSKYLVELFERIEKIIPKKNIIAIDDASQDNSAKICRENKIKIISFPTNKGKGAALQAGFLEAVSKKFSFAISIDSDLQHKPEDIPKFINKQISSQADMIIGKREFSLKTMPWARIFSNSTTSKIVSFVAKTKIPDSQSGFRLYRLSPLEKMNFISERYQFETEIILKLAKQNGKFDFVPIETIYNDEVSYISHFRDIGNFVKIVCYEFLKK